MSKSKREKKEEQLRLKRAASTVSPSQGVLAQLVRAPPCHGGGCGFEPRRLRIRCCPLPSGQLYLKATHPLPTRCTLRMIMRNGTTISNGYHAADGTLAAMKEMELYCATHPRSPAAVRRPRLSIRGRTFVALLGPAIEEGIAGFGDSVQAAVRAFDAQYSRSLTPPADRD